MTQKGWDVRTEIPDYISEGNVNHKVRSSSRDEFSRNLIEDEDEVGTHYKAYTQHYAV